jgi:hypothetical protein
VVIGALIQWTGHYDAGFIFMAASATISALLVATIGHVTAQEPAAQPVEA